MSGSTYPGAYLGIGMSAVRGSAEKDQAIAHLEVRPCKAYIIFRVYCFLGLGLNLHRVIKYAPYGRFTAVVSSCSGTSIEVRPCKARHSEDSLHACWRCPTTPKQLKD